MAAKRALVVDDSKSARVVLSRMLEKYGIAVDTADSAEMALDFLRREHPDVVFMDHLMPGMDGLQAVRILKADPATAAIPVVMYTSQEGELYVGQAKALGAVGVLPKTVKPIDVTKVLYQLRLLPDRRDDHPSQLQPVEPAGEQRAPVEPAAPAEAPVVDARTRGFVEAMLKEQSLELRRFMVAALDSHAQRLVAELKRPEPEAPEKPAPVEAPAREHPWPWILAFAAALLALVVLASLYWQSAQTAREVGQARERLERESAALQSTLEQVREAGRAEPPAAAPAPAPRARVEVIPVPYGEPPLSPGRLEALRTLLAGLERGGFAGTVTVETVPGEFCLEGSAEDGYSLAQPEQPASACEYRGNPYDESLAGAARQPVAFANLAASVRRRTEGRIQLALLQGAADHVVVAYPAVARATAGAWNEAASANNRLEISVLAK